MINDIMKMDEMLMNSLKENDILKQRINKAIEYIEERFTLDEETGGYHLTHTFDCDNICELYLILKGSDSNE